MISFDQSACRIYFKGENYNNDISVVSFTSRYIAINKPYLIYLTVLSRQPVISQNKLNRNLCLEIPGNMYFHGFLKSIRYQFRSVEGYYYQWMLASPLWKLQFSKHNRIFLNKNVTDVLREILSSQNEFSRRVQFSINQKFITQDSITQYLETDYHFFQRLIFESRLFYLIKQTKDDWKLIISDQLEVLNCVEIKDVKCISTDGSISNIKGIYSIQKEQSFLSAEVMVNDHHVNRSELNLVRRVSSQEHFPSAGSLYHYGRLLPDEKFALGCAKQWLNSIDCRRQKIIAQTNLEGISPGQLIRVEGHIDSSMNQLYRVISVMYYYNESDAHLVRHQSIQQRYQCRLILIDARKNYDLNPFKYSKPRVGLHRAIVDGNTSEHPDIDQKGRYVVKQLFARAPQQQSQRIFAVQTASGCKYGMHFPFYKGTEVIVVSIDGDVDRPVILGVVNNAICLSPVTAHNRTQHIIRSYAGHMLLFEDQIKNSAIKLITADQQQQLCMINSSCKPKMILINKKGTMLFQANKQIRLESSSNQFYFVRKNHQVIIGRDYFLKTQKGNIRFFSGNQFMIEADQGVDIKAREMNAQSLNAEFLAKNAVKICAEGDIVCEALNSFFNLKAGQMLKLIAPNMIFKTGGSCLEISGQHVSLSGTQIDIITL